MRKFIAPLLLLCTAFIIFFSCRKIEYIPNETLTPVDVSDKFFTLPGTVDPLVKAIHDRMFREEKQKPYVNQFVKWAGFPIWNKAMITSRKNSTSSRITLDSTTEVLLLPFAKDSQMSVSALVVAIIHQGDTTLRALYHFQYKDLPYDNGRFGSFSAEKAAILFMGFDKAVFGTELFYIKDSLLFGYATPDMNHRFIKMTGDLTINKLEADDCWETDQTGGDCDEEDAPHCDIGGMIRMDCEGFDLMDWFILIGGSGSPTGGDPGGGSPGGGGGTPWNDNPCKSIQGTGGNTCGSGPAWLPIIDDDGSSIQQRLKAWDDTIIVTPWVRTCTKNVLDTLRMLDSGTIAKIIYTLSGNVPDFNWTITEQPYFQPSINNESAETLYDSTYGIATTILNIQRIANATNLSLTRTLIHEAVHAYLVAYFTTSPNVPQAVKDTILNKSYAVQLVRYLILKNPSANIQQHNLMVNSFRLDIKQALLLYCSLTGITDPYLDQICDDLSWGGLEDTDAFNNLSDDDKARIIAIISSELFNQPQTVQVSPSYTISPIGKKACN